MATPKGLKQFHRTLPNGDKVLIYSNQNHIMLQLRREVPTELNLLEPSFKVAVDLSPVDALLIASELFAAAALQMTGAPQTTTALPVIPADPLNQEEEQA
ncbi:hypothetical protein KSF_085490 [Reticulibacter mediterranei]|uniref:Uncharacterized protein n=1 Tax=Reticulibacter mediterranei TaxID=2778369 RepID=A0A8J3IPR5_9CHLR|nr:hypothetical protein [Reticulibacter mediterranei]GHO98501.1 hypothetical protein KSF_085490 [Reticulibacter mediterranei]